MKVDQNVGTVKEWNWIGMGWIDMDGLNEG